MQPKEGFSYDFIDGTFYVCTVCSHAWRSRRSSGPPRSCPGCSSRLWADSYRHECIKCGHTWNSSRPDAKKCPGCQTLKWNGSPQFHTPLSDAECEKVRSLYARGYGVVRISRDTGLTFGDVLELLMSESDGDPRL